MRIRFQPAAGLAAMCLFTASVARPCSKEIGKSTVQLPPAGAELPANLVRFRLLDGARADEVSLRTKAGIRIAVHVKDGVLMTTSPPAPGELVLTYPLVWYSGKITSQTRPIKVGDPTPLELRTPVLEVIETGVLYPNSPRNRAAFARLQYYSPDANGKAAHLFEAPVTVDGRPYRNHQETSNAPRPNVIEVKSLCGTFDGRKPGWEEDGCGELWAAPEGAHTVTVTPHVIGETSQPAPVSVTITLSCPGDLSVPGQPASPPQVGIESVGDAPPLGTQPSPNSSSPSAAPRASDAGGCALAGRRRASSAWVLALGVGSAWRRRRRAAVTGTNERGAGTSRR